MPVVFGEIFFFPGEHGVDHASEIEVIFRVVVEFADGALSDDGGVPDVLCQGEGIPDVIFVCFGERLCEFHESELRGFGGVGIFFDGGAPGEGVARA